MAQWEEIEKFGNLVAELELPRDDFALFGVKCPYCGKTDRIHKLEKPSQIRDAPPEYERLWNKYSARGEPVMCMFCRQALVLAKSGDSALRLS
jgi:hypothetical protein